MAGGCCGCSCSCAEDAFHGHAVCRACVHDGSAAVRSRHKRMRKMRKLTVSPQSVSCLRDPAKKFRKRRTTRLYLLMRPYRLT